MGRIASCSLVVLLAGCGALVEDGTDGGDDVEYVCGNLGSPSAEENRACRERGRLLVEVDGAWECLAPAADDAECRARGGTIAGEPPYWWACWEPASDAGAPCANDGDCYGTCEAPPDAAEGDAVTGHCSDRTGAYCSRHVRDGVFQGITCI